MKTKVMKIINPESRIKFPRRSFFRKLVQGGIGVSLAVTGVYLFLKEGREDSCSLDFTCTLCGKSEQCGLPAAKSFREYERSKQTNNTNGRDQQGHAD